MKVEMVFTVQVSDVEAFKADLDNTNFNRHEGTSFQRVAADNLADNYPAVVKFDGEVVWHESADYLMKPLTTITLTCAEVPDTDEAIEWIRDQEHVVDGMRQIVSEWDFEYKVNA